MPKKTKADEPSRTQVARARYVLKYGTAAEQAAVKSGKVSLSAQVKAIRARKKGKAKAAKKAAKAKTAKRAKKTRSSGCNTGSCRVKTPDQILAEAAETYVARNPIYGSNHLKVGAAMEAMFPDGLMLRNAEDFVRLHLLLFCVTKLCRYGNNFANGGHRDSIHDCCVYSAILEAYDARPPV